MTRLQNDLMRRKYRIFGDDPTIIFSNAETISQIMQFAIQQLWLSELQTVATEKLELFFRYLLVYLSTNGNKQWFYAMISIIYLLSPTADLLQFILSSSRDISNEVMICLDILYTKANEQTITTLQKRIEKKETAIIIIDDEGSDIQHSDNEKILLLRKQYENQKILSNANLELIEFHMNEWKVSRKE
jgi:hypothetical protein